MSFYSPSDVGEAQMRCFLRAAISLLVVGAAICQSSSSAFADAASTRELELNYERAGQPDPQRPVANDTSVGDRTVEDVNRYVRNGGAGEGVSRPAGHCIPTQSPRNR